jgi:hypothetical protein
MSLRPAATFTGAMLPEIERDTFGTVLAITGKTCRVQLAGGDVISGIAINGAVVGQTVRLRYSGGTYTVQGGAGGGSGSSALVGIGIGTLTGAPSPHDLLGVHHTLPTLSSNVFLGSPYSASGMPSFRALGVNDLPAMTVGAGDGLTGGGDIRSNPTLNVVVTNTGAIGLTVEADAVRLTSSSNPGTAAAVLASDSNGYLRLVRLGIATAPAVPLHAHGTGAQIRLDADPAYPVDIEADSQGNLWLSPYGDVIIDPGGEAFRPANNGTTDIGSPVKYFLTAFVKEIRATTLVAEDVMATIGGRLYVAPSNIFGTAFTSSM